MALTLQLRYQEQNDNKAIILTDITENYGAGGNPSVAQITAVTLDVSVTTPDGTVDAKPQIDLLSEFGPFASQADMVYTITAALLGDTSGSLLVDGLYALTYTVVANGVTTALQVTILVYGQVKLLVYQKLRQIPNSYVCNDARSKQTISEADLCGAYLSGIENSAYVAKTEELLSMLTVLNSIVLNGSNITW